MSPLTKIGCVLVVIAMGCAAPEEEAPRPPLYVGALEGSDALIALAPEGNLVVGYVCAEQRWAEHSGWFFTELEDDAQLIGRVKTATSGTGHTLEGVTLTPTSASGTVRFADGATHTFTAALADPRTTAGLYESHAAEGQAGLIITNDGRAAGAAKLATGSEEPAAVQPVTVTQPTSSGTGTGGIQVSVPGLGERLLPPLIPSLTAVTRLGPTLFVLVHGMNHPVTSTPDQVDSPAQSRTEWHLDFVQGLLGGNDPNGGAHAPMFNFAGQAVTQANFMSPARLPRFDSFTPEAGIETLDAVASHFITLDARVGDVRQGGLSAAGKAPSFSALITYRDAAGGLAESGKRIANETYVAVRWYEQHFRRTPKVIYVTQSFGGVVARFVLSNPTQAQLSAAGVNADAVLITPEDRRRMDYVRDRIVYLLTMGTPHEGSFIADMFVPLQQDLLLLERSLDLGVAGLQGDLRNLGLMLGQLGDLTSSVLLPRQNEAQTLANVRAGLAELRRRLDGRALRDLVHPFWVRANTGPLHPSRARRTAASPLVGAGGQLIPIYAAGARTPGRAFTAPELAVFDRFQAENPKEQEWMVSTLVTDLLLHTRLVNQNGFGRSNQGLFAGFDAQLDRRQRLVDGSAFARTRAQVLVNSVSPWFAERFGAGVEGVVNFAMGDARLVAMPIHLDRTGHFDLGGTVVLPVPAFECVEGAQRFRITLEFGRLLTSMRATFGSLTAAGRALRTRNLNGVLEALALTGSNLEDILRWFLDEYSALGVPEGRCKLPVDLGSVLSAGNLLNWTVVDATDTFPAPRWVREAQLASDDEIDDDGVVAMDSAVGFSLGTTTPLFFDHTRLEGTTRGSWYRIFDSPVEAECHGMQHQWNIGSWALQNFFTAGPVPGAGPLSVFP
ncbi:MAG: hypothetical protein Q8L48_31595 [Archangium sp.]|nr:hypothetical protein [Archangium sp.]